jgi:hypothetical protein
MRKQVNARSRNNLGNNVSDTGSDLDFTAETIRIERQWNAKLRHPRRPSAGRHPHIGWDTVEIAISWPLRGG